MQHVVRQVWDDHRQGEMETYGRLDFGGKDLMLVSSDYRNYVDRDALWFDSPSPSIWRPNRALSGSNNHQYYITISSRQPAEQELTGHARAVKVSRRVRRKLGTLGSQGWRRNRRRLSGRLPVDGTEASRISATSIATATMPYSAAPHNITS